MYEVFWNEFLAMIDGAVSLKTRIAKCVAYICNNRVSANEVNIRFQYVLIYYN